MYLQGAAYGGPIEDFRARLDAFYAREADYQNRVRNLPKLDADVAQLRAGWMKAGSSSARDAALLRLAQLGADVGLLRKGSGAIAAAIGKARSAIGKAVALVRRIVPGFGVVDPATVTAILTAAAVIAASLAIMGAFISRDNRLRDQIALERDKLEAVAAGVLPPDSLTKPNKPDTLDKLTGLGTIALGVAALVFLGPLLKQRAT